MVGLGKNNFKENRIMNNNLHDYVFISKHDLEVKKAYENFNDMIKDVQDYIRSNYGLTFRFNVIGSYKHNMITYDQKSNIDFDFNIEPKDPDEVFSAKDINYIFKEAFDYIAPQYGYRYASRSSRVFTINNNNYLNSSIKHSCDIAIVNNYQDNKGNNIQEYIHFNKKQQSYCWQQQGKGFYNLPKKIKWIKNNNLWNEYRECYLGLKNTNQDENKHSRSLRAEAAHIICQQYGYY